MGHITFPSIPFSERPHLRAYAKVSQCNSLKAFPSTSKVALCRDTPSTLIFIAAFDIFLTFLEESGSVETHAYADDLEHITLSLSSQQIQADLVCGLCAFAGLEI